MFFENDWILRQINMLVQFVARIVFKKDAVSYEIEDEEHLTDTDELYKKIRALLGKKKICEAEDLLFDNYAEGKEYLTLALDFYQTLSKMSDDELEQHNFSRQEIYDGLKEIVSRQKDIPVLPFGEDG